MGRGPPIEKHWLISLYLIRKPNLSLFNRSYFDINKHTFSLLQPHKRNIWLLKQNAVKHTYTQAQITQTHTHLHKYTLKYIYTLTHFHAQT